MKTNVLFLCTGNSARSQMAEGFLRHMARDKFEVYSAGVKPTQVNPLAIKVMAEVGVDISKHKSKSAMEFVGEKFDYVITVCDNAKQTCPVFPESMKRFIGALRIRQKPQEQKKKSLWYLGKPETKLRKILLRS